MACKCSKVEQPTIYINDDISRTRKKQFLDNQGMKMVDMLNEDGPYLYFQANDILALWSYISSSDTNGGLGADALRIYFAIYDDNGSPSVPDGYGNKFTFVFAPALSDGTKTEVDLGIYFSIPPGGSFNPGRSKISAQAASRWVTNWQEWMFRNLPVDEVDGNFDGTRYCDTKSMIYTWKFLGQLYREIPCQEAEGVKISLAAYPDEQGGDPAKRLTTQFILTDGNQNDLPIDITCRPKPFRNPEDFDTGNPCPPATGCSGSSLPLP
ncbi:MAG TPA: hypothetical protein VHE34_09460 [Puia sp.]|uniref:hypothetical protein n=1 Tax=Puia sp. TaxID=2045100 RepID=UPI002CF508BF|nr:hypothetical protein [Puia sp.]HVU95441.1 hypothetical protein [Puia sp.]